MIDFNETPIYNAKVKFSSLGPSEDGNATLWYQIGFECEAGTVMTPPVRVDDAGQLSAILNVMELRSWEELTRKFARIRVSGKSVIAIGNLIQNKWVYISKEGVNGK